MVNLFLGKRIPSLKGEIFDKKTQDEFCESSNCENDEIDCNECLFDSKRCPKEIFENWLKKLETNE